MCAHADTASLESELALLPRTFPGLEQLSDNALYLLSCRNFVQFCGTYRSIVNPAAFCLFCNFLTMVKLQPIRRVGGWYVKPSDYKYDHHEHQFVLFPARHVTSLRELTDQDAKDLLRLEQWLYEAFNLDGCSSVMRSGNPRRHVGTVPHIHKLVNVPDGRGPAMAYFGKSTEHWTADYQRTLRFLAEIDRRGGLPWLLTEGVVIEDFV